MRQTKLNPISLSRMSKAEQQNFDINIACITTVYVRKFFLSRGMLNYFLTDGGDKWTLLKNLAIRIFFLISSSACVERTNSTMGFIHSKLRNKLSKEKIIKLFYIKNNTGEVMNEIDFEVLQENAAEEDAMNDESDCSENSIEQDFVKEGILE